MAKPDDERVRELEQEVTKLRAELADVRGRYQCERDLVESLLLRDLPRTEEEVQKLIAESQPFKELIDEFEREIRPDSRS